MSMTSIPTGCCRYTAQAIIRGRELRALLLGIKQFTDETF